MAGAPNPGWVGGEQVGQMRFEGDRLVLESRTERPDGAALHTLTWRRIGGARG